MKDLKLLVWLTEFGLCVALPPSVLIWLASWLQENKGWGSWVMWVGVILGVILAVDGLRQSLKLLRKITAPADENAKKPISFNEHD